MARASHVNSTSTFFRLPLEIRQEIYRHVFGSSVFRLKEQMQPQYMIEDHSYQCDICDEPQGSEGIKAKEHQEILLEATRYLRSNGDNVLQENTYNSVVTALLATSHQIYVEALPVFYGEAHIHFSIKARLPLTLHAFQSHLPLVKHLTLDFSYLIISYDYWQIRFPRAVGETPREIVVREIADTIDFVVKNCPRLRSFALHLLSDIDAGRNDFLHGSLLHDDPGTGVVVEALGKLRVRDTISIIAVAGDGEYARIRTAIAPLDQWTKLRLGSWPERRLVSWPGLTLSEDQIEALQYLLYMDEQRAITMWSYKPPTSKS
ncbi:hypothetical protein MMC28_009153 [Mycoblastus sanguinarius]|nr:hypothetical protein [Mycoblastus sanguinarius]